MKRSEWKDKRKKLVLKAIQTYQKEHNSISPSIREIMGLTGLPSTSIVRHYLDELEKDGSISKPKRLSRSIVILRGEND